MTVRVVTWNLWWRFGPWEDRHRAIEATLAAIDPDVVCLQETWVEDGGDRQADRLAAALELQPAVADAPCFDGLGIANAVLSRWPIARVETHPLPGPGGRPSGRHALVASLEAPFGPLPVLSTHLHHYLTDSAVRVAQATRVAELVDTERRDPDFDFPVVVGGDLNAVPWADEIRLLTGATRVPVPELAFTDCWEHAGDGGAGHTWAGANPYLAEVTMPNRRLDYLLVSWPRPRPLGNPVRCWLAGVDAVDGVQPSDHYAVVADLVTLT